MAGAVLGKVRCLRAPGLDDARLARTEARASRRYPNDAWEVLLGYDQEKMMGDRAGAGLLPDIQAVDKAQRTPADAM